MADDYSPVPGKFKAMKWDGTNTAAVKAWVQTLTTGHTFTDADWQINNNGDGSQSLSVWWSPDTYRRLTMIVNSNCWAVFGPYWGSDPTEYWTLSNSPWTQMSDAYFQQQFGAL